MNLDINKVEEILKRPALQKGLEQYKYIVSLLHKTDVSLDIEFQQKFRQFYQMRRFYSDEYAKSYFRIMENMKYTKNMNFEMAFERVKHIQGRCEISFSSKLAHTINPEIPIWDRIVATDHFGIKSPYYSCNDRFDASIRKYMEFQRLFYTYLDSGEGKMVIELFDKRFPENRISDVKKLDFVLWQDRCRGFSYLEKYLQSYLKPSR